MAIIDNAIYDRVASTWWEEDGFMALLRTSINPPRFEYFREVLVQRLAFDPDGLRMLDVGCGGGLLSESFAALGCQVTGVDRSLPTLAAARAHAGRSGLVIDYREGSAEALPFDDHSFDVVCCCDVLEHVDDVEAVVAGISRVLRPGGVFFFDTINRTLRSKLVAIKLAQDWRLTRLIPRDVHVWDKFIRPDELTALLDRHGMGRHEFAGLSPAMNPLTALAALVSNKLGRMSFAELGSKLRLRAGSDLSVSYMGYALRSA
ncbi:MAG TPA: bifunctional 2-polyprenyl-6-hydroxyphenol methylase/3-demethylubiquinol 3-O-methyltransferase UbiG [Lysobacter sp.]